MSFIYHLYSTFESLKKPIRRFGLKSTDFSIISNNCWGGFMYQYFGLPYKSPFVGLFIFAPDYISLLENFEQKMNSELNFININQSRYYCELVKSDTISHPIGTLGKNVEIHFLHYHSNEEALKKWEYRKKRLNPNKLIFKFCDRDLCTPELIERFDKIPYQNKICFTAKPYPEIKSVIWFREFENKEMVDNEWEVSHKYLSIKKYINQHIFKQQFN